MDAAELLVALEARVDELLRPERASHSRAVAALASAICGREGLEPARGGAAGLAHDLCKEFPREEQRRLAAGWQDCRPGSALMADKIVHGPAAAALLRLDYGVDDAELLEAVALHTVGRPGMGSLAAAVYCADKLEPGRAHVDPGFRERCLALPLDAMLREVVGELISWFESRGRPVAPETHLLYNSLTSAVPAK